jgi:hypothetical protein
VDVDYPVFNEDGLPEAVRPQPNAERGVHVFPTWDARELSRFVCTYKSSSGLGRERCNHRPPNRVDARTGGRPVGNIECPTGFSLRTVGTAGGRVCVQNTRVLGPFTSVMVKKCLAWGGAEGCAAKTWNERIALDARGNGLCPDGAFFDNQTGYCAEGVHAFGPFPATLVERCVERGGGPACFSARWNKDFLAAIVNTR